MSASKAIRSRVNDLQTHCWPTDAAAVRELWPAMAPLFTSFTCPELCVVPVAEVARRNPSVKFSDITGLRYGAMVVVGLVEWRSCGRSLWALRCDCGRYEPRNYTNVLRGSKGGRHAACHVCAKQRGIWDGRTSEPFNGREGSNDAPPPNREQS